MLVIVGTRGHDNGGKLELPTHFSINLKLLKKKVQFTDLKKYMNTMPEFHA